MLERRKARHYVEYRLALDRLTQTIAAHAVVTLGHCWRVLDLYGDETLGMESHDPRHWWVKSLQLAGPASGLQVTVTPSAAEQIAHMDERAFQMAVPVIVGVRAQLGDVVGTGLVRAERGSSHTLYLMIDDGCACFGAGGDRFQPGRGYELSSHNFRLSTHILATLAGLAHLSTVMDNTRTAN